MTSKEIIVIGAKEKEVADFLEKLRVSGHLRVQLGTDVYSVKISAETVSESGRDFLTKGGRTDR